MLNNIEGFGTDFRLYMGVVEDNNDPIGLMRVRVRWFGIHPESKEDVPTTALPWATTVQPSNASSNSGVGLQAVIKPGTWVVGFFADGREAQFPWVLGTIPGLHRPNGPGYGNGPISDGSNTSGGGTGTSGNATGAAGNNGNTSGAPPYHGASQDGDGTDSGKQTNNITSGNIQIHSGQVEGDAATCAKNFPLRHNNWGPPTGGFRCRDGSLSMHYGTAQAFELLQDKFSGLSITSGYRSQAYQDKLRAAHPGEAAAGLIAKFSQHTKGRAIDVGGVNANSSNLEQFLKCAVECGFVGFGFYPNFIHIDTGSARTWGMNRGKWEAVLNKYGWEKGKTQAFALLKGDSQPKNNPPSAQSSATQPTGSSTGPRMAGALPAMSTTGTQFWTRGFKDPTNSWPTNSYRGRVSTNYAMLGVNSPNTFQTFAADKETGRSTGYCLPKSIGTFGEPSAPYAAMYPHNTVFATEKHILELDDTEGAERVNLQHKTGSYMEMDANGTRVDKTVGDKHQYDSQNSYHGVEGDHNLSTNGNINQYAGVDRNDHVNGNATLTVKNDGSVEIAGVYSIMAGDRFKIRTGKLFIEAEEVNVVANSKMMFHSKGEFHIKGKTLNVETESDINLKSGGKFTTSTAGDTSLKSGGKTTISGSGDTSIKSGGKAILDGSGAVSIKGSGDIKIGGSSVTLSGGSVTAIGGANLASPPWVAGGSSNPPDAGSDAGDATAATEASDADLGDPSQLARTNIDQTEKPSSPSLSRPSYNSHGAYGSTGNTTDAATSAGDESVNASGGPNVSPGSSSDGTGGADTSDGDAVAGESYGQPAQPASSDNPSLFTPDGVQKYVTDFSYKRIKGGQCGKPSQDLINGFVQASRKTNFPLDLFYLFAAYESNFQGGGARGTVLQGNSAHAQDASSVYSGATGSGPYAEGLATAGYIWKYKASVEKQIGRKINRADAYLIHFLGPGGAPIAIKNAMDPNMRDQKITPQGGLTASALSQNAAEFYKDGNSKQKIRTWAEFYNRQCIKFGNGSITEQAKTGNTSPAAGPTGPQQ